MITERTLRNWRKDSLVGGPGSLIPAVRTPDGLNIDILYLQELHNRILRLTQELLDLSLLKKGNKS